MTLKAVYFGIGLGCGFITLVVVATWIYRGINWLFAKNDQRTARRNAEALDREIAHIFEEAS